MQHNTDNTTSQWVITQAATPDFYLPHNLPEDIFQALANELSAYQQDPEKENILEGMVAITMGIMGANGITKTDHEEISQKLHAYIKIYSIERLKRTGIIVSYTPTTLENVFDEDLALDIQFSRELVEKSPEIVTKLFTMF